MEKLDRAPILLSQNLVINSTTENGLSKWFPVAQMHNN